MKTSLLQLLSVACLSCLPLAYAAAPHQLVGIKASQTSESARLELKLNSKATYKVFALANPNRLVIDILQTHLNAPLQSVASNNSLIKMIRVGHPDTTTLRLVLDLKQPVKFNIFSQNQKIFLDAYALSKTNIQIEKPIGATKMTEPERPTIKAPVLLNKPSNHKFTVVIDPGHGGRDPGALGGYGTKEKNVVLGIAVKLAKLIEQEPTMQAVLTRHGDYFVTLADRLKLSRKGKADLFVAIHADSYFNNKANGASVYALSRRGATSLAARWLASRENHSELGGVDLRELEDQSVQLRSVLIDLAQTATTTDSLRLGNSLLDSLDSVTNLHYSRVEQAPFMVLKSPDIPSVLVEIGFLSNLHEEEKLRDERYQQKMAQALFNGIRGYVKKYSMAHL